MYSIHLRFSNCSFSPFDLTGRLKSDGVWQLKVFQILMEGSSGYDLREVKHCLWSQEWTASLMYKSRQERCNKEPQSEHLWVYPTWSALPETLQQDLHALLRIMNTDAIFITPGSKQGWAAEMTTAGTEEKPFLPLELFLSEIDHQSKKWKKIIENMKEKKKKHKNSVPIGILVVPFLHTSSVSCQLSFEVLIRNPWY